MYTNTHVHDDDDATSSLTWGTVSLTNVQEKRTAICRFNTTPFTCNVDDAPLRQPEVTHSRAWSSVALRQLQVALVEKLQFHPHKANAIGVGARSHS